MSTKVQFVFNNAMAMMDEMASVPNAEGHYVPNEADTVEYLVRTLSIVNVLAGELYPYSDTYQQLDYPKRPICPVVTSMDDELGLDDYICRTVMPYGLAAHLLLEEDPTAADFFQQRYDELKAGLMRGLAAESGDTYDVYGGGYYKNIYDKDGNLIGRKYIAYDPIGFSRGGRWG